MAVNVAKESRRHIDLKKNILIKQILGTDAVKQDTMLNRKDKSSLTATKTESKMQPMYEFKYSQRCYCGHY